jgi:hypothetical protein
MVILLSTRRSVHWHGRSFQAGAFNASPTSHPSRAVRARGGRGDCAVHGWEMGLVEVGHVQLRGRVVMVGHGLVGCGQLSHPG